MAFGIAGCSCKFKGPLLMPPSKKQGFIVGFKGPMVVSKSGGGGIQAFFFWSAVLPHNKQNYYPIDLLA